MGLAKRVVQQAVSDFEVKVTQQEVGLTPDQGVTLRTKFSIYLPFNSNQAKSPRLIATKALVRTIETPYSDPKKVLSIRNVDGFMPNFIYSKRVSDLRPLATHSRLMFSLVNRIAMV